MPGWVPAPRPWSRSTGFQRRVTSEPAGPTAVGGRARPPSGHRRSLAVARSALRGWRWLLPGCRPRDGSPPRPRCDRLGRTDLCAAGRPRRPTADGQRPRPGRSPPGRWRPSGWLWPDAAGGAGLSVWTTHRRTPSNTKSEYTTTSGGKICCGRSGVGVSEEVLPYFVFRKARKLSSMTDNLAKTEKEKCHGSLPTRHSPQSRTARRPLGYRLWSRLAVTDSARVSAAWTGTVRSSRTPCRGVSVAHPSASRAASVPGSSSTF